MVCGDEAPDDGTGGAAQAALGRNLAHRTQPVRPGRGRRQRPEGAEGEVTLGVAGHVLQEFSSRLDDVAGGRVEGVLVAQVDGESEHIEPGAQVAGGGWDGYASAAGHRPNTLRGGPDPNDPRTTCIDCCRKGATARCE